MKIPLLSTFPITSTRTYCGLHCGFKHSLAKLCSMQYPILMENWKKILQYKSNHQIGWKEPFQSMKRDCMRESISDIEWLSWYNVHIMIQYMSVLIKIIYCVWILQYEDNVCFFMNLLPFTTCFERDETMTMKKLHVRVTQQELKVDVRGRWAISAIRRGDSSPLPCRLWSATFNETHICCLHHSDMMCQGWIMLVCIEPSRLQFLWRLSGPDPSGWTPSQLFNNIWCQFKQSAGAAHLPNHPVEQTEALCNSAKWVE